MRPQASSPRAVGESLRCGRYSSGAGASFRCVERVPSVRAQRVVRPASVARNVQLLACANGVASTHPVRSCQFIGVNADSLGDPREVVPVAHGV